MCAEGIEVRTDLLDIDGSMGDGLCSIQQDQCPSLVRQTSDLLHGIDRAEDIADMGNRDEAGTLGEETAVGIHIQLPEGGQRDDP